VIENRGDRPIGPCEGLGPVRLRLGKPPIVAEQIVVRGGLKASWVEFEAMHYLNEVQHCYESEAVKKPGLPGRVWVQFVVDPNGQVISSNLQSSTMRNTRVESCLVNSVRHWTFGSNVMSAVTVPFDFSGPGASTSTGPWTQSLAIVRANSNLSARTSQIAKTLGAANFDDPAEFAWCLAEWYADVRGGAILPDIVIANLLKQAGQKGDAARILSEVAPYDPAPTAAEFRRWRRPEDAKRVETLARR
jgi:hypothetical protein